MAIADGLNADRVATAQGGLRWYPATVRSVAISAERTPVVPVRRSRVNPPD